MVIKKEAFPLITIYTIAEWRAWLAKHHLKEKKVGLVSYKKHTGKSSISHREAMNEAICFGWIDTIIKRIDDESFIRYFVRRGDKANWSINTLSYAKQLHQEGKMTPHGLLRYQQGLQKKPHDHGLAKKPKMPKELREALAKDLQALKQFNSFQPSTKYMLYRWILRGKQQETREKRTALVVKQAKNNKKEMR